MEGSALVTIKAPTKAKVFLNDEVIDCSWQSKESIGFAHIDLTNQVGFHRIRVVSDGKEASFDFGTSTAKATWIEIQQMAEVCASNYLGYRKQFTYVSRTGEARKVIIPQIVFAWFRDRILEIERLISEIAQRPATELRPVIKTSLRAKGVSIPATIKLLHEHPSLLEQRNDGPILVSDVAYWPSVVRVRDNNRLPARDEHSQIASFLSALVMGVDFLRHSVDGSLYSQLDNWRARLVVLREASVLRPYKLSRVNQNLFSSVPTAIQRVDSRYRRIRDLAIEYQSDIGSTEPSKDSIRGNVKDAWEIYQTFIAHVIGNSLGLNYVSQNQDMRFRAADGASMINGPVRMYFDQKLPRSLMTSWRDESQRPANERPDVVLTDPSQNQVLVLDAKFKTDRTRTRADSADLFEMQGYLNSFGINSGGIVFPGNTPASKVAEGRGNKVAEIPLRAQFFDLLDGVEGVHEYIRAAIAPLWTDAQSR
jgi:hypothetical protein